MLNKVLPVAFGLLVVAAIFAIIYFTDYYSLLNYRN